MSTLESLSICGVEPNTRTLKDTNPTGQSCVIKGGDYVIIARPFSEEFCGFKLGKELKMRVAATKMHEQVLPNHTLNNQHVILQGFVDEEPVPVLGRFSERLEDVHSLADVEPHELLADLELCDDISAMSVGWLKMLMKGKRSDCGFGGNIVCHLPKPISNVAKHLVPGNAMIGYDTEGKRKVFCDPDWYNEIHTPILSKQGLWDLKNHFEYGVRMCTRIVFFKTAALIAKAKEKSSPHMIAQRRSLLRK